MRMKPSCSPNEAARLAALNQYQILDTPPEAAFDDLAQIAAQICGTPIALVSLVDEHRQWFKACVGLQTQETSRAIAFCTHAIQHPDEVLIVPDTLFDERFVDNPLVCSEPYIRFYAGAPLVTAAGHALGTICVLDSIPRELTPDQIEVLQALSRQAVAQLELRRKVTALEVAMTERKQMENALHRQAEREHLVTEIAQRIRQSLNLEEILNTTVSEVRQLLQCDRVFIYRFQPDWSGVVVVESVSGGWESLRGRILTDPNFVDYVQSYRQGRIQATADIDTAGLTPCYADFLAQLQIRADLVVPILQEDQLWGLLVANHCAAPRPWQQWEIHLLKQLSTQVAIAIQQSELYQQVQTELVEHRQAEEELRRQNRRSQLFAELTLRIRQSLTLDDILQTAVTEVRQLLQADRALIFRLWREESGGRVVKEAVVPGWPSVLRRGVTDDCFGPEYLRKYRQGRVYTIDDVEKAAIEPCLVDFLRQFEVKSKLVIPVLLKEELWGLLIVHQCSHPRQWTPFEMEILQQLADQIGIALAQSQLLEQATQQSQELARSNLDLEQFAYVASHDLQEPLRMVASYLQLLERRYRDQLDETANEFIDYAVDGAKRMQTLINDLLTYSRVTSRGKPLKLTSSQAALKEAIANLEAPIEASGVQVTANTLPEVMADATQLTQLFQNLISNAIKFRQQDEPPRIQVRVKQRENEWCFAVQDNGVGIERQYAERIFLIFQRLHGRSAYPGTGIGLAICKKIVERFGGSIWVESEPGKGSTFYFTIPNRGGKEHREP